MGYAGRSLGRKEGIADEQAGGKLECLMLDLGLDSWPLVASQDQGWLLQKVRLWLFKKSFTDERRQGAHSWRRGCVKKACLGIATCVLLVDAVRPPGPLPVFCVMKMCFMCPAYCFYLKTCA